MATKSRLRLVAIAYCSDCPYSTRMERPPFDWLACGHPKMAECHECPPGSIPKWCPLPVKEEKPNAKR